MGAEAHFHVPRLEPMGAASSDSLSGGSNSSQPGDDSTERLSASRAKVHPMDREKGWFESHLFSFVQSLTKNYDVIHRWMKESVDQIICLAEIIASQCFPLPRFQLSLAYGIQVRFPCLLKESSTGARFSYFDLSFINYE